MTAPDYAPAVQTPRHGTQDLSSFDGDPAREQEHQAMAAAGVKVEEKVYVDTFSFFHNEEFVLPSSGGQTILYRRMTEGKKAEFQKLTNQDVRIQRTTGDAKMRVDPASERHHLIRLSVTDWTLVRYNDHKSLWETVPFSEAKLKDWLNNTDPSLVQALEKDIRAKNEWMNQEATVEAIDEQIVDLQQKREALIAAQEKEVDF